MKKILIYIMALCALAFVLSRMIFIPNPKEAASSMLDEISGWNFNQLSVFFVGYDEELLTIQDRKLIKQFLSIIKLEEDVGAVMSAGTYRFAFFEGSEPTDSFQLVLGEYLRHEGGHDYLLSEQSSRAIRQWLADYNIKEPIRGALENLTDGEYSNSPLKKNNCQDWCDRLREEYEKIVKERGKCIE